MSSRPARWLARTSALAIALLAFVLALALSQGLDGRRTAHASHGDGGDQSSRLCLDLIEGWASGACDSFDEAADDDGVVGSGHLGQAVDGDDKDDKGGGDKDKGNGKGRGRGSEDARDKDSSKSNGDRLVGVAAGPPVADDGNRGRPRDRNRRVNRDKSVLDDVIGQLRARQGGSDSGSSDEEDAGKQDAGGTISGDNGVDQSDESSEDDEDELSGLVERGTIGDVFRELRRNKEVKEVIEAIVEAVKGEAVIEETKDLQDDDDLETEVDKRSGKERKVVRVKSARKDVTVTIPVQALRAGVTAVSITVTPIDDVETLSASVPLPVNSVDISDTAQTPIFTAVEIDATDQDGQPITQFEENVTFSLQIDPATEGIESIRVVFFDDEIGVWVQVPSTVDTAGVVEWSVDHLTLFALLRLAKITHTLLPGLNPITFTGALGTTPSAIADLIGEPLQNLLRFDEPSQTFFGFVPNAPATVNTLNALAPRDALFLRVAEGETVQYSDTDIVPNDTGDRRVILTTGLNAIGFTGSDSTSVTELLATVGDGLISAAQFDPTTQTWLTFVPGAPVFANTLTTLDRLDVLFVRYSGPAVELALPEVAAP